MKEKIKSIILIVFYFAFFCAVFLLAYFELPKIINISKDKEEIRIIKEIYKKLEEEIPEIDEIRGSSKEVSVAIGETGNNRVADIANLFAANFTIDTIYKEREESDYQFCLNRYTLFMEDRVYTEKCHDVNTIEYFNKKNMFTVKTIEPAKMVYTFTTMYKEDDIIVYTDYEVTLTNTDGTWKISDGVIIVSDDNAEYFVYIDKPTQQ